MLSGKTLQLLQLSPLVYCVYKSAIRMMFVKIILIISMLVGIVVWAKADTLSLWKIVSSQLSCSW